MEMKLFENILKSDDPRQILLKIGAMIRYSLMNHYFGYNFIPRKFDLEIIIAKNDMSVIIHI